LGKQKIEFEELFNEYKWSIERQRGVITASNKLVAFSNIKGPAKTDYLVFRCKPRKVFEFSSYNSETVILGEVKTLDILIERVYFVIYINKQYEDKLKSTTHYKIMRLMRLLEHYNVEANNNVYINPKFKRRTQPLKKKYR
jgi:hypothetical protein